MSCSLRPVDYAQRAPLERLTAATGLFRPDEVAIAVELLDDALAGDDDYRFLGAYADDRLVGYACWGPTPGTTGTFSWMATRRAAILSPMDRMAAGGGPMKTRPAAAHASAKPAFSARKP